VRAALVARHSTLESEKRESSITDYLSQSGERKKHVCGTAHAFGQLPSDHLAIVDRRSFKLSAVVLICILESDAQNKFNFSCAFCSSAISFWC
jgi:hypothetical protein